MERIKTVETLNYDELTEHKQRIAFHEAGHAAGICLNNKAKQLPPVYFKIIFKGISSASTKTDGMAYQAARCECWAYVEGGRLIECLPLSIDSLANNVFKRQETMAQLINDYMLSFEADITNLLIGPLAEAKHVAEMDDELFNHKLVNLKALENYGGKSELDLVNEYLQSYSVDKRQQDEKLNELFEAAFNFISVGENWTAITKLAAYILAGNQNIFGFEEIVSTLNTVNSQTSGKMLWAGYSYG